MERATTSITIDRVNQAWLTLEFGTKYPTRSDQLRALIENYQVMKDELRKLKGVVS